MLASAIEENATAEIKPDKRPPPTWLQEINLIMWCSWADVWEITFLAATLQNVSTDQKRKPTTAEKDSHFGWGSDKI